MTPIPVPPGLTLRPPAPPLLEGYLAMIDAAREAGDGLADGYALPTTPIISRDPAAHLQRLRDMELGINLPDGYVPMSTRWLTDASGAVVGETRLRHRLTPSLELEGGHVGYMIHPAHRGRGYGHAILALALRELADMGIGRILVTCNADNARSRRVIERNGGVFDRYTVSPRTGVQVMRFWIESRV